MGVLPLPLFSVRYKLVTHYSISSLLSSNLPFNHTLSAGLFSESALALLFGNISTLMKVHKVQKQIHPQLFVKSSVQWLQLYIGNTITNQIFTKQITFSRSRPDRYREKSYFPISVQTIPAQILALLWLLITTQANTAQICRSQLLYRITT